MKIQKERTPWQRLALSLLGIGVIVGKWQWGVYHLYSLPEASISAFTTISINSDYVIGAIVIFMVTGKLIYDWKNNTATNLVAETQSILEKIERKEDINIKEEKHIYSNTKEEDYYIGKPLLDDNKYEY